MHRLKQDLLFLSKKIEKASLNLEEKIIKIRKDLNVESIMKMLGSKVSVEKSRKQFESMQTTLVGFSQIIDNFKNEFDLHK